MTHAQDRLFQRFGVDLTNREICEITSLIQQQKSVCIERASKRRATHILRYKNRVVKVVYSTRSKWLVTALPFDPDIDSIYVEQLDLILKENFNKEFDYIFKINLNKYLKLGVHESFIFEPEKIPVFKLRLNGELIVSKLTLYEIYDFIKTKIKDEFDFANSKIDRITYEGLSYTIGQNKFAEKMNDAILELSN